MSAAFEAAVAAKQAGAAKVVMLEKAPEPEFGGNARYSHTGFRWVFSGADEIRRFLPEVDDAMFAKLNLPAYSSELFHAVYGIRGKAGFRLFPMRDNW